MHVFFYFKIVSFLFFCQAIDICTYVVRNEKVKRENKNQQRQKIP